VQINSFRMFYAQQCASRHRFLRSAEPDIHLQSQALKGRHRNRRCYDNRERYHSAITICSIWFILLSL
jgi:hypothetical protein